MNARQAVPVPETLKRINMRRFVDQLRVTPTMTRAELTRITGVSSATSSSIIAHLQEIGIIEALDHPASTSGRPATLFRLATQTRYCGAIAIGVEETTVGIAGLDGKLTEAFTAGFSTPKSFPALMSRISKELATLMESRSGQCVGIGLCAPGLIDEANGRSLYCPSMPQIENQKLKFELESTFQVPALCIQENHGLCLAEQHFGAAGEMKDFVLVDVSTGIGAGIISRGRRVTGTCGQTGELGHITVNPNGEACPCGNRGCLETYASESVFVKKVSKRLGSELSLGDVLRLVGEGVLRVDEELDEVLSYLSMGIATLINLLNPEAVFLHGDVFDVSPNSVDLVKRKVSERALNLMMSQCTVQRATVNKLSGALAGILEQHLDSVGPRLA